MPDRHRIVQIEDYEQFVESETIGRILDKAGKLQHLHVANVNSTYYGGGVAELLTSLTGGAGFSMRGDYRKGGFAS